MDKTLHILAKDNIDNLFLMPQLHYISNQLYRFDN